jgi:predicted MFS family arabinose efflux permease
MYALGAPIVSFVASFGGWRFVFLTFVFIVSLIALLLTFSGLPPARVPQSGRSRETYLGGFKSIFSNRSAVACLVGPALSTTAWQVILLYSASFLRQQFLLPTSLVSINSMVSATSYTVGNLVSGRFVNKFGRKPLAVSASLLAGLFIMSYMNIPNLWIALIACQTGCFFAGFRYTAATNLTLEQVPAFRGTMMSLYSATDNVGRTLGAGVGGLVLLLYSYGILGLSIGAMAIIGAILLHFLAIDPTKTQA